MVAIPVDISMVRVKANHFIAYSYQELPLYWKEALV
jgi:hypothetical protein